MAQECSHVFRILPPKQMPESNAVASLQLAPHGVVRSIYPMRGNEAALGLDLLKGAGAASQWAAPAGGPAF
jgi:sensor domain CHASE-containing protein